MGPIKYYGNTAISYEVSHESALRNALWHLQSLATEEKIRSHLGLPHRPHIAQFDSVRDQLRFLKARIKRGSSDNREEGMKEVGKFYQDLDRVEKKLLRMGFQD